MHDSRNKTRAGRFPEVGAKESTPCLAGIAVCTMPCREREESRLDAFQKSEGKLIPTWKGVKILRARPTDRGEKVKEREKCVSIFFFCFLTAKCLEIYGIRQFPGHGA